MHCRVAKCFVALTAAVQVAAGITVWRNNNETRQFAKQWAAFMNNNELHERGIDDQASFNELMTSDFGAGDSEIATDDQSQSLVRSSFPLRRVEEDPKVFYVAPGNKLKLMVLPSALFAGMTPPPSSFGWSDRLQPKMKVKGEPHSLTPSISRLPSLAYF